MTPLSQRLLVLYVAALLALALLGAHNQGRLVRQHELAERQTELQNRLGALRREAAQVTGALAVRSWATGNGMVASPDALNITDIKSAAEPELAAVAPSLGGVEVQTLWH